ncbi:hypothetical protein [Calidifontibacillus oryziterrae]|uniref:hypothetical protein n=1 Tax=Calidifontibacillus oryziterrae TaxID=1191699 RepID=UPI00030F76AD|nr:hypothetical protein [Calidifontibacillus oryziterrae]
MKQNPTKTDLELQDRLNKLSGKLIHITKNQNRDLDDTMMTLSGVNFHERPDTIDGYVAPFVLQLHGKGQISTSHAQHEQIPYETYEIPLAGQHEMTLLDNEIIIHTDDSNYSIKYH